MGGVAGATGGTGGEPSDASITPKCTMQAAITKPALSKVTWVWQSYADQKVATNQCIACKNTPCIGSCWVSAVNLLWDTPAAGQVFTSGDGKCDPTVMHVGTCGSEVTCNLTPLYGGAVTAEPFPTATGWKLKVSKAHATGSYTSFSGACGSNFIDGAVLGSALTVGMKEAYEATEFPCP